MIWEPRLIGKFEPCQLPSLGQPSLAEIVSRLIEQQRETWPLLRDGYAAFEQAQTRRMEVAGSAGSYVLVQYNPGRIRSTAAAVDRTSVESRACFLCPANLPPEEKGIAYGPDLVIACNPFPVLDRHLSVMDREHVPQRIEGRIESLLALSHDLGPDYFALYNGPQCGASAPDHFHLQACAHAGFPIEEDFRRFNESISLLEEVRITLLDNCGRTVVVFRAAHPAEMVGCVSQVISGLRRETGGSDEPMVNIVAAFESGEWTLFLFPRSHHRPLSFFAEGDEKLVVSPGAIDMAGVVVTPRQEDFVRLTPVQIAKIFSEVSLSPPIVERVLNSYRC
jgi:hypothetical protein